MCFDECFLFLRCLTIEYTLEVVVADQCNVFFGAGRTRLYCHTTLSLNPLNQLTQSQSECYFLLEHFKLYSVPCK